jgi:uncharacterized protein (TIGR02246 family)
MKSLLISGRIIAVGQVYARPKQNASDENALRKAVVEYNLAWNNHDARAIARIFADDADVIGGAGGLMKWDAFEKIMAEEHATVFKNHELTTTVDQIRFLKPDISVVDGSYRAIVKSTSDSKPYTGLFTLVMRKTGGKWLCVAMRSISQ